MGEGRKEGRDSKKEKERRACILSGFEYQELVGEKVLLVSWAREMGHCMRKTVLFLQS